MFFSSQLQAAQEALICPSNPETRTHLQVSQSEFQFCLFFASSHKEWFSLQVVFDRNCFPPFTKVGTTEIQTVTWD